eukprot:4975672-Amphidinium_carterae.1
MLRDNSELPNRPRAFKSESGRLEACTTAAAYWASILLRCKLRPDTLLRARHPSYLQMARSPPVTVRMRVSDIRGTTHGLSHVMKHKLPPYACES